MIKQGQERRVLLKRVCKCLGVVLHRDVYDLAVLVCRERDDGEVVVVESERLVGGDKVDEVGL